MAVDDVRALHATPQQFNDALQLRDHSTARASLLDQRFGFVGGQPRQFCLRLAGVQENSIYIREQDQLLSFELNRDRRSDSVGVDIENFSLGVRAQRRDAWQISVIPKTGQQPGLDVPKQVLPPTKSGFRDLR